MNNLPTLNPTNLTEAVEFAKFIATSGHIPKQFQGKPNDILVAIQWGYEIGLAPMQALQNIAVINGRPSLWGDSLIAVCKHHSDWRGIEETYIEEEDKAVCIVKRNVHGKIETTRSEFSYKDAQKAKLANKQGPWQDYPKRMMQLRARGFALRDAFPDAIKGLITVEEAQDYPTEKEGDIKTIHSDNQSDVIEDIKNKVKSLEGAEKAIKYTMYFIGKKSPIIYANANDFINKYMEVVADIYNSEYSKEKKSQFMDELRTKNMATISSLNEILQSEMEIQMGEFNVSNKNTNDQTSS
tara:strand:+ start:943 stop:1833 length:891 start_codon:yes stop_codon:yes gene_type:complete